MKKILMWAGAVMAGLALWWAAMESAEGAVGGVVATAPGAEQYTNAYWIYSVADTNNVYVAGAGEGNGQYTFKTVAAAGVVIYTNVSGAHGLIADPFTAVFAHQGIITNSAGSTRYQSDDFGVPTPPGTWAIVSGAGPAPTGATTGTNFFTNNISAVAPAGPLVRTDTNFWVSGYLGNDSTFSRGVGYAKTLGAVFSRQDLTNGDVVVIWPGPVEPGTNGTQVAFTMKTGMRVVGFGPGITRMVTTNGVGFNLADNCVVSGLSIESSRVGNNFDTPLKIAAGATNWLIDRVNVPLAFTDCLTLTGGTRPTGKVNDCDFSSLWDTFFDPNAGAAGGLIEFNRCVFRVTWFSNAWGVSFNSAKCIAAGTTGLRFNHCYLYMDGGASTNASCLRNISGTTAANIEFNSCVLTNRGTGTNFAILNDGNASGVLGANSGNILLRNTTVARSNIYGGFTVQEAVNDFGYGRVTGSAATTTGQSLVDATGLSVGCDTNAIYEVEAVLSVTTTAVTTGTKYGVQFSGAGASFEGQLVGSLTSTASQSERVSALNTATANAYLTTSGQSGQVFIKGLLTTGAAAGNVTIQHLKVTSGTSTIQVGSYVKAKRIL